MDDEVVATGNDQLGPGKVKEITKFVMQGDQFILQICSVTKSQQ